MSVAGCDALGQAFLCQTNADILSSVPLHAEDFILKFVCENIISAYMELILLVCLTCNGKYSTAN
jgi:hypothetical protein